MSSRRELGFDQCKVIWRGCSKKKLLQGKVGRHKNEGPPRKRWVDDVEEFHRREEIEENCA